MKTTPETKEDLLAEVDNLISPENMSLASAADFLEELISDLQIRLDAMREEV